MSVHCEGHEQHRGDAARQTFTVSLLYVPLKCSTDGGRGDQKKKEGGVMWQHWVSVMETGEGGGGQMATAAMVAKRGG